MSVVISSYQTKPLAELDIVALLNFAGEAAMPSMQLESRATKGAVPAACSSNVTCSGSVVSHSESFDVDFDHLQHCLHDPLGLGRSSVPEHRSERRGND